MLVGSNALAIPAPKWFGVWECGEGVDKRLLDVITFLKTKSITKLNLEAFENDVHQGLRFDSNIPEGYGLGSSAALTAGIFDKYYDKPQLMSIKDIVEKLAIIESCFHGESSGFDPIVSYLNRPVICVNGEYQTVEFLHDENTPQILLINSGSCRNTQSLVAQFKIRMKDDEFAQEVIGPLKLVVDTVIEDFVSGEWKSFWTGLRTMSTVQRIEFNDMSPDTMKNVWKKLFAIEEGYVKLCGAGGGGYYLGFAQPDVTLELFEDIDIELIDLQTS